MPGEGNEERRLSAIVFTDLVGFTSLSQRDELFALQLLSEVQALTREKLHEFAGREVKSTGDGFLLEFSSAVNAVRFSLSLQGALHTRYSDGETQRVRMRIGIHVGDVVNRGSDIYGDGVNIAARVEPLAVGGGICISSAVHAQVHNKVDAKFNKLPPAGLKGVTAALDVYRVWLPWDEKPSANVVASKKRVGIVVVALVATSVLAIQGLRSLAVRGESDRLTSSSSTTNEPYSVAVLPFVSMSPDKSDEYIGDGMTEELLNALAGIKGLRVPGRTSCFAFKGQSGEDIFHKVGKALNVQAVIEGSVRKVGKKLRVTAQLINVADGYHIWSETYDRTIEDLLMVQSDVARKVVDAIRPKIGGPTTPVVSASYTKNSEAYRLYLLGRYHSRKRTVDGSKKAIELFNAALKLDPKFPLPYVGLANDNLQWNEDPAKSRQRVRNQVETALRLDPNLAEAHASLGAGLFCDDWDFEGADREFRRALDLNPDLPDGLGAYGVFLATIGRSEEGVKFCEKEVDLEPLSAVAWSTFGMILFRNRDFERSIEACKQAMALDPTYAGTYSVIAWSYLRQGLDKEALEAIKKFNQLDPTPTSLVELGCIYAATGNRDAAGDCLARVERRDQREFVYPSDLALLATYLGNFDRAFQELERGVRQRDWGCFQLMYSPIWEPLRRDPRTEPFLERSGLVVPPSLRQGR